MFRVLSVVCSCALVVIGASPLSAQDAVPADTAPFRRGQWAAQFGGGLDLTSLAVLRFTSPTTAWMLDLQFTAGHTNSSTQVAPDTLRETFASTAFVSPRVGRRFYRSHARQAAVFLTVGAQGSFSHSCGGQEGNPGCSDGWGAGVFAEVGGSYLPTRHLSVGAVAGASLTYQRVRFTAPAGPARRDWQYAVGIQRAAFVATIYF